ALLQWTEALRGRRLGDVHRPAHEPLDRRLAGRSDRVLRLEPRLPQEATRERGDQRRIEGGKARELDTDFVAHRDLLTLSRSRSALRRRRDRSAPPAHAWRRSGVAPRAPRPRPSRV